MKEIKIKKHKIEMLIPGYDSPSRQEDLEALLLNADYNNNTDWEAYRKVGNLWRKKKRKTS